MQGEAICSAACRAGKTKSSYPERVAGEVAVPEPAKSPPTLTVDTRGRAARIEPTLVSPSRYSSGRYSGQLIQYSSDCLSFLPRGTFRSVWGAPLVICILAGLPLVAIIAFFLHVYDHTASFLSTLVGLWPILVMTTMIMALKTRFIFQALNIPSLRIDRNAGEAYAGARRLCRIDDIIAVQVISGRIRPEPKDLNQMNVVYVANTLGELQRRSLVAVCNDLDRLLNDARRLGAFLGVPLVDQVQAMAVLGCYPQAALGSQQAGA